MNFKGGIIAVLFAIPVTIGFFVGLQYAIWGGTAPDWYAMPVVLGSAAIGMTAAHIGLSRRTDP